jgi:hypothetical protein
LEVGEVYERIIITLISEKDVVRILPDLDRHIETSGSITILSAWESHCPDFCSKHKNFFYDNTFRALVQEG